MAKAAIVATYLVYIAIWETILLGGCGYVVFVLGYSGWWFALAVVMSGQAYSPDKWADLWRNERRPEEQE